MPRSTNNASDERRLFPTYGKSQNEVRITPGQTFNGSKSRAVQRHAFKPVDRISQRGLKDSGPVRASGASNTTHGRQNSPVSRHPLSSPTLHDDDNRVLKRMRRAPDQIIHLVDDDDVQVVVRSPKHNTSRARRSPSVVSVESAASKNDIVYDHQVPQSGYDKKHAKAFKKERQSRSPLQENQFSKPKKSYQDKEVPANHNVENQQHEVISEDDKFRPGSEASESLDELQRDFLTASKSRPILKKAIRTEFPMEEPPETDDSRVSRRNSPSDIPPTVFGISKKNHKKKKNKKEGKPHRHLFNVKFFRYGDIEFKDQDLRLSIDEKDNTIGLLEPFSHERIPIRRVSSVLRGSNGNSKVRFKLSMTEGSMNQSVDLEFRNDQEQARLCDILQRKGITTVSKEGPWMDKAFANIPKNEPRHLKRPNIETVETSSKATEEPRQDPVKRQKLSTSLQGDNGVQSGLKQPPRRLPISIETPYKRQEDGSVNIPVKKHIGFREQRETRSKVRQSLVDLIDDEPVSASDPVNGTLSGTLVYPREGRHKAEVHGSDIERLHDPAEFLNDNLITFYLRFLEHHLERNNPDVAKRVYFFNSYFFEILTKTANGKRGINYEGVQKWTRNVDLFSRDYVIVPINQEAHWYVAIICNLASLGKPKEKSVEPVSPPQSIPVSSLKQVEEIPETPPPERVDAREENTRESFASMNITESTSSSQQKGGHDSEDDWPEKEENQVSHPTKIRNDEPFGAIEMDTGKGNVDEGKNPKRKGPSLSVDQPTIVTFDSLGLSRQPAIKVLRTYLIEEAVSKRSLNLDPKDIKGMTAKEIPLQPNFSDCGLYLLAYLEKFVQDPDTFMQRLLRKQMSAEGDWPALKSGLLRQRLRGFLLRLQQEQKDSATESLVDVQPISYLLGPSASKALETTDQPLNALPPAEAEVVPEPVLRARETCQDEDTAPNFDEIEVIRETQLSQLQNAESAPALQEVPTKTEPNTTQPYVEKKDTAKIIEEPKTPEPNPPALKTENSSLVIVSSPKSTRKGKKKHSSSEITQSPKHSKHKQTKSDLIWDEIGNFLAADDPVPKNNVVVEVPRVQVPGTPPPVGNAGKAIASPRQSKSKRKTN
ncbi:hypothetical protein BGW36DRAFT_289987 [Talaromyces proteolyticus]|uniref:Ubiquitin-like protease family profile domain-containing protein n=1 Tax=Talaromyces proteolyticus TaxID=1131652 RepID=A0AAD4KVS4_9EURO|nr:uncharacterized protein BGW36DRAFT_289987 [Talaromyces proteolyticus]KAH8702132.1 hypothetical protein BGW36DRAFT_289987 [Talaromyces proteolyticus]